MAPRDNGYAHAHEHIACGPKATAPVCMDTHLNGHPRRAHDAEVGTACTHSIRVAPSEVKSSQVTSSQIKSLPGRSERCVELLCKIGSFDVVRIANRQLGGEGSPPVYACMYARVYACMHSRGLFRAATHLIEGEDEGEG